MTVPDQMAIFYCWSAAIPAFIVIFGVAGLGVFFAWHNKKIVVSIIGVTLSLIAFLTISLC
jgi:hypothetical protein